MVRKTKGFLFFCEVQHLPVLRASTVSDDGACFGTECVGKHVKTSAQLCGRKCLGARRHNSQAHFVARRDARTNHKADSCTAGGGS